MDFSKLKAKSGKKSLEELSKKLESVNGNDKSSDDRFWSPTVDKAGNGYAVIRFLPAPADESDPFVLMFSHAFQGPGGWYIENSLTTLGQNDPLSEYNSKLWNSGIEANKEIARKQKRKMTYISNIYVVSDPSNPDNEGKVFLFKYGKKIFDKLKEAMNPQFADEEAINPFDFWTGANFKLKIRNLDGYRNYDRSEFDRPAPLFEDDSEMEKIWKTEYSLVEFHDPKNFKSYDALKAKLHKVLGEQADTSKATDYSTEDADYGKTHKEKSAPSHSSKEYDDDSLSSSYSDDDDGDLDFFKSLAE